MKKIIFSTAIICSTLLSGAIYTADGAKKNSTSEVQTICPVLGFPIDKNIYTDYKGRRIYFCCSDCIGNFKSNPEFYMKKLNDKNSQEGRSGHMHM